MHAITYDPTALVLMFYRFLDIVQPLTESRRLLQRLASIWLTGHSDLQKLIFFYGLGANAEQLLLKS